MPDFTRPRLLAEQPLGARVWMMNLDRAPAAGAELLSASERARAERFAFERDRRRYITAHVALRQVLAEEAGLAPSEEFTIGVQGKPCLQGKHRVAFNLSHSAQWAAIAIAPGGEVGIDIEVPRTMDDLDDLARSHFTPSEQAELMEASEPSARVLPFFRGWTRKEACLKAIGSGLSIEPVSFTAGLAPTSSRVEVDTAAGLHCVEVISFETGADILAALARSISR